MESKISFIFCRNFVGEKNLSFHCESVGAAGPAARQLHGPMCLTQKETICQGQMLLNV